MSKEEQATPFAIPSEMRDLAEQSVEQAKTAFNTFITAAHDAVQSLEGQAKSARVGAKDAGEKAMSYAERNVETAFDFAQKLVHASSMQDVVRLQGEFVQAQMEALSEQARDLAAQAKSEQRPAPGDHRAP
jgi:phasin